MTTARTPARRWLRRFVLLALAVVAVPIAFDAATRIDPPALPEPAARALVYDRETVRAGDAYLARRGRIWVMQLAGTPVELGYAHARLASPLMADGDGRMLDLFAAMVPSRTLRALVSA